MKKKEIITENGKRKEKHFSLNVLKLVDDYFNDNNYLKTINNSI